MPKASITIWADGVEVRANTASDLIVELTGVDVGDVVSEIGAGELLDAIGEEAAIKHFGIEVHE